MKRDRILQVLLAIVATCLLSACVGISFSSQDESSSSSQEESNLSSPEESFWEGQVRPGTYSSYCYGWHHNPNRYADRTDVTFTIYDNKDIKIKKGSYVFYGTLHKYEEIYDGERKVWYGAHAEQEGSNCVTDFNLSTDLQYSPGDARTYQEFSSTLADCH